MNPGTPSATPSPDRHVLIRITRRDKTDAQPYVQEFSVPVRPQMNIISALQYIAAHPTTTDGKSTTTPVWDAGCLEEVCGACTMVINGRARQACSTLVEKVSPDLSPITLEPMTKFPVVRDLFVDRSRLFNDLKRVKAWVPIDGTYDLGPGPAQSQKQQETRYPLSRCISCGCCLEACPQYHDDNYIGPQAIAQARYQNMHPTGKMDIEDRLNGLMGDDGITNCGNAQNCIQVCPMSIPLTRAIYETNRDITVNALFGWLRK
jgi:succinate dehydrogenase / fumarate reductase iron-sulfur subunit